MIHRLRKEEETDELKRLLTELTDEMRSKYFQQNPTHSSTMTKSTSNSAPNVDHTDHIDIVTENHEPKSLQAKETADKYKQLRPNQHYLSPDSNFVSTPIVSSSAREKNIGQEEHSYKAYSNPSVAVSLKNESQVEKLRKTQNQVLQSLKKTCNIRTTEELAASSVEIHLGDFMNFFYVIFFIHSVRFHEIFFCYHRIPFLCDLTIFFCYFQLPLILLCHM